MALQIKDLLGALVGIVVGVVLFPIVNSEVQKVNATGVTGGGLISLIPMMYILLVFSGASAYVYLATKKQA